MQDLTNADRAARVCGAVERYASTADYAAEEISTVLVDFVTDLRHYVDAFGADWADIERMATVHFVAEQAGE